MKRKEGEVQVWASPEGPTAPSPSQKKRVLALWPLVTGGARVPSKQAQREEKCKEEKESLSDTRAQGPSLATSPG